MKIGIHQPNLIPWFPFFYKMAKSDIFVLMINCQFEKNGFQNRCNVKGEWWTAPVMSGTCLIKDKKYANGNSLSEVNVPLILGFARLLGIDTSKIHYDFATEKKGTERIIEICKMYKCDEYLTNPEAMDKYLDEKEMNNNAIEVVACDTPYKKSLFEMFETHGIDGTAQLLYKNYPVVKNG